MVNPFTSLYHNLRCIPKRLIRMQYVFLARVDCKCHAGGDLKGQKKKALEMELNFKSALKLFNVNQIVKPKAQQRTRGWKTGTLRKLDTDQTVWMISLELP